MTITRPHVCEITMAKAEADDHGTVAIHVAPVPFTVDEAREFAVEVTAAADAAAAYIAEQTERGER
ncbi:hypothetical protein [Microbacterium sp. Ag1]|uniref:hypothetical protein n=1 Tax=Microbacterium sp. Ag1 TaxID=1643443 RepID=UPI0006290DC6|nr:hypothetical protein [Microbacterium sp. Ag1]KKX97723.1 hypothetical protein AAY78_11045 [Microbacterium sp. Ag1]